MKNRRMLVRLFCLLLACVFLPMAGLAETASGVIPVEAEAVTEIEPQPEPAAETVEAPEETPVPEETLVPEESQLPEETQIPEETDLPEATPEPTATPLPGSGSGSFCLAAYTDDRLLIAPMVVNYAVSDTVSDALEKLNGHSIVDLESGEITQIDGVGANFSRYDEEGGYDLSRYASEIDALVFTVGAMPSEEMFALIRVMARYSDSAEAKDSEAAAAVYREIVDAFISLSDADASEWAEKLTAAMKGEEIPAGDPNAPAQADGVYQISTGGELKWFADHTRENPSASAVLTADVSLSGIAWTPIGSPDVPYTGSFDGRGCKISNLTISASGDYQALFGYAGSGASIANLTVSGTVDAGGSYTAGVIAYSEAGVSNLHNRCKVTSSGQYVGGVVGAFANKNCTAADCSNSGSVYASNASGAAYAGGVLGGRAGRIENCKNTGPVTGHSYVGGVAGQATDLTGCENSGDVQCVSQYAGGVAGRATGVTGCENSGAVTVTGVYVEVRARYEAEYIGGVAGYVSSASDCQNSGRILARESSRTHFSSAAGVVGKASKVSDCENRGAVNVAGSYIAGVVGGNGGGTVVRCVNYADVRNNSASGEQTGGVASAGKLEKCYNLGAVTGFEAVGGVAGGTANTTLKYCYNLGSVSGSNYVGGVAGNCLSASRCYSAAPVKASGGMSGLALGDYSDAKECFYLNECTLYSKAGTGLDRAQLRLCMRNVPEFKLNFDASHHGGYPLLDFESSGAAVAAERVAPADGGREEYFAVSGSEAAGLPETVRVQAGGLEFECAAGWIAPLDFDGAAPGRYAFTPDPVLPEGCYIDEQTELRTVTVVVCAEEELPLVTSVRLEDGAAMEYAAAYGKNPEGLPGYALATIDGAQQRLAVEWTAPENLDLTDTGTEFFYTMRFCEACRLAEGVELPAVSVRVQPMMLISEMRFTETVSAESRSFDLHYQGAEENEGVQTFRYSLDILDSTGAVYLCAVPDEEFAGDVSMEFSYNMLNDGGYENRGELKPNKITGLSGFAASSRRHAAENTLTVRAQSGETVQEYVISTVVRPTLNTAVVMMDATAAYMTPAFDGDWTDYRVQVVAGIDEVELRLTTTVEADRLGGISLFVNDEALSAGEDGVYAVAIPMGEEDTPVSIRLLARGVQGGPVETEYRLKLMRLQKTMLTVNTAPEDAKFRISNAQTGSVFADADGRYSLIRGFEYGYSVSAYGYITQSGVFTAEGDEMTLDVALEPAEKNENIQEDLDAAWGEFRGDETNNAVSGSSTPVSASDAVLYWANKAGLDYGSDAVSSPILADGYLICTAKQNIFKIDTVTGEIVQVGDMIKKSAFNITPPTYAKGMIFVALADGVVQAFNAKTLESLWVYTDPLGGQPNSPVSYRNGYIYTGFWNGETDDGNWVCLSITDENLVKGNEAKQAVWTYTQKGGFYWAGACVQDDFMIVGTDDGATGYTSPTSNLLSLDPDTGRLIDCLTGLDADIRCTICYDRATDRYYFTSKGGFFYSVAVSEDGYFLRDTLKKLDLRDGRDVEGMSTSTPVVYNGRAYVGVSGLSQFQIYSGHGIAVIDLEQWKIAYLCPTKGYPQTSGLLTTAYENTGLVYVYFFDNMTPGSLRVIRDCPGQTELLSIYDGSPIEEAEILFTPRGSQRQYALCSPIVDEYGTFYFKNDSGHMMALGSRIVGLEVTQQPDKLLYEEGETFDPKGMRVIQHLTNGCTKDVTESVSWSLEPLTAEDTDITIYFDYVRYNNDTEVIDRPQTAVNLTVLDSGDMAALRQVVDAIDALGNVTIESGEAIREIRANYDALPVAQQELVTNYEKLTRAEEEYGLLELAETQAAESAVRLIDSIGEVTQESADTIRSAFELYNGLSAGGKALVTNHDLLLEKQEAYNALIALSDAAANAVMSEIANLGEITVESGSILYPLRDRYESLPEASKRLVTNLSSLESAEAAYAKLIEETGEKSRRVIEMIEAIGQVTLDKENAILRARAAYDALDEAAREGVTNYEKLTAAEEQLELLKRQLDGMGEITAQLDEIAAQIHAAAADETQVTAQNAARIAPLVQQMSELVSAQSPEDRQLLDDYSRMADVYRIAIGGCVHEDASTGLTAEGLEWYQQLTVETLASASDADYSRFEGLIAPQRVIKLYRVSIVDLIHGSADVNHSSLELRWTMPVPRYNESSYSAIGVVHVGEASAAQYLESSYANNNRSLKFATRGDGLIGVGGTKAQMSAAGSVSGSGSVLGGVTGSGSVLDEQPSGGTVYPEYSYGGASGGSLTGYSQVQSAVLAQYENAVETGEWYYRDVVILPALLAELTDAQVNLYTEMSRALEEGRNRFFGYAVTPEEFEQVYEIYRMSNPLSALAEMTFAMDEGMVEANYALSEDAHLDAVDNWRVQVERIVNYCLIQGDPEITAARLYQHLAQTLVIPATEWMPAADDPMQEFWPGPYYALMNGRAAQNDAAKVYAYLLMQAGMECMLVREVPAETEISPAHLWTVLWQGQVYTHADLELDLFSEAAPDADRSDLGHFGMGDERRAQSANAENGYVMAAPESMLPAENEDKFVLPRCSEALVGYAAAQTEPVEEVVEQVVEEVTE